MKLSEKGRFAAPPKLKSPHAQRVATTVASWDGVHARSHWLLGDEHEVDGVDFYLGEDELGHIHLDAEAHVMLPKALADALIEARLARPLPWSKSAVVYAIKAARDVEHALWLFSLSRDRRLGETNAALLARIANAPSAGAATSFSTPS